MGYSYIEGFLQIADFDTALAVHCSTNCYPSIHPDFIPCIKEAIYNYADDNLDKIITLPNGITMTSYEAVTQTHTESFVEYLCYEGYDND